MQYTSVFTFRSCRNTAAAAGYRTCILSISTGVSATRVYSLIRTAAFLLFNVMPTIFHFTTHCALLIKTMQKFKHTLEQRRASKHPFMPWPMWWPVLRTEDMHTTAMTRKNYWFWMACMFSSELNANGNITTGVWLKERERKKKGGWGGDRNVNMLFA